MSIIYNQNAISLEFADECVTVCGVKIRTSVETDTEKTIKPNIFYKWTSAVESLNITLDAPVNNTIYNEYMFYFISGDTPTNLIVPSNVYFNTYEIKPDKAYHVSIVNNLGVIYETESPNAKKYTVNLNSQWKQSTVTNPDPTTYEGVYESYAHTGSHNTFDCMSITFKGYTLFTVYIRSYAESSYDYTCAGNLDGGKPTSNTYTYKISTKGTQTSGTSISSYTKVDYTCDKSEHTIWIWYRKDGSASLGTDKGYVLIPKKQ